ncbi:MAG TPA: 16S rRNA (cytosine(967)-C(5))-methyltransferase RsmB [Actinomycetota bacterium]|nr:16S rRNA (cytosine(967)-C(5))-methyltransferase RsmB [Actinomycetota bacterium]
MAFDVVRRVTDEGAYSNLALRRTLEHARLPERDAAFASELSYGTLRRLVPIDHALGPLLDRPLETAPKPARAALRLGAYQLLYLRTPPHAAVSETVALVDARQRGFVNAVLRRLSSLAIAPPPPGSTDDAIALRTGLAAWAVRELQRLLGEDAEEAAGALAERGSTTLRVNTCRGSVEDLRIALADAGTHAQVGTLQPDSLVVASGAPSRLPGFDEGLFTVQDQASSFVVRALDPQPGERVLDVCSAPGGKAGHLSCLVGEEGEVVAGDVSPVRLGLVRETLTRLGLPARLLVQDGRRPALREGFDAVLVDAPCSGIGSARRRPELLWRTRRDELSGLARLQVGIATAAAGLLRPGGRLVYSVCTFPRAETDAACDAILRRVGDLEPIELAGPDGPAERIRLWPHRHGCDAMFVAGFRRRATPRG